jgi:transposase
VAPEIDLSTLTVAEKDALILSLLPLVRQLEAALARIATFETRNADLEARLAALERPRKTPDNSSLPPSKGQKPERPAGAKPPRPSRPSTLLPDPDRVVDARLGSALSVMRLTAFL